jgi:hypothetical protein
MVKDIQYENGAPKQAQVTQPRENKGCEQAEERR